MILNLFNLLSDALETVNDKYAIVKVFVACTLIVSGVLFVMFLLRKEQIFTILLGPKVPFFQIKLPKKSVILLHNCCAEEMQTKKS